MPMSEVANVSFDGLPSWSQYQQYIEQNTAKNNVGPGNKVRVHLAETCRHPSLFFGMSD